MPALLQAVNILKNKRITISTSRGDTITGTLKQIGDDFIELEEKIGKSIFVPARELVKLEEV